MEQNRPAWNPGPAIWVPRMVTQLSTLSGVASAKQLLTANPNRYFLAFSIASGSGSAVVKPQSASVNGEGFLVPNGSPGLRFQYNLDGEIVQEPWFIGNYSLSQPMLITEGLWVPGGNE